MNPFTDHQARYFALELRRRASTEEVAAIGTGLFDARVVLQPHQVEAALFALGALRNREAEAGGRILADEVGLGKTIEAGLVLCQLWAERKRRLLVITPAALRKQWALELEDKFGLRATLAESKPPATLGAEVWICSYEFARRHLEWVRQASWDLVVCDEAHRLRAAYDPRSKQARPIAQAIRGVPRLLLTATPLQNSLLELYGLATTADSRSFGELSAFKERYVKGRTDWEELKRRLAPVLHRSLRKDLAAFVAYTQRLPLTEHFIASAEEQRLHAQVGDLLAREELVTLPRNRRGLVAMAIRKLMASSSAALGGVMRTLQRRAERLARGEQAEPLVDSLEGEGLDPAWLESLDIEEESRARAPLSKPPSAADEAREYARLAALAEAVAVDERARHVLKALNKGFAQLAQAGAPDKAVIFTESRLTQSMLRAWLERNGYAGQVACFQGGRAEPQEQAILDDWLQTHPDQAAGASRGANLRAATVAWFRERGRILIATESGAEGLNLQFCSFVVNYDLPWNPQRVEQRIGRCHRYGQLHDVVVLNLLEQTNPAEQRVYELLSEKFKLFEGLLGASDSIIGSLESGVGFERRLHRIFDQCRSPAEIEAAFAALRAELEAEIAEREARAKQTMRDHFDTAVHDRVKIPLEEAQARMNRIEALFWSLSRWALHEKARFEHLSFTLDRPPEGFPPGRYELVRSTGNHVADAFVYRLTHPLGERVLKLGAAAPCPAAVLRFRLNTEGPRTAVLDELRGRRGWLSLDRLRFRGFAEEEQLVLTGLTDSGAGLPAETLQQLLLLPAQATARTQEPPAELRERSAQARQAATVQAAERNEASYRRREQQVLDLCEDLMKGAEADLEELRSQEKEQLKLSRRAPTLEEKQASLRRLDELGREKLRARERLFRVEDEASLKRQAMLAELDRLLEQQVEVEEVFAVAFEVEG